MDPDNALTTTDRAEILAELYVVAGADQADKAIEQHTRMLRKEPFKYDSYKALAQVYAQTQQYDKYFCLCSTLAFLQKADADQHAFYEQYKPRGLVKAQARDDARTAGPSSRTPTRTATSRRSSARAGRASRR